jgi:hypothetical protein
MTRDEWNEFWEMPREELEAVFEFRRGFREALNARALPGGFGILRLVETRVVPSGRAFIIRWRCFEYPKTLCCEYAVDSRTLVVTAADPYEMGRWVGRTAKWQQGALV